MFMPRYFLATLLLLAIPAAAGAAHASRGQTALAGVVVAAATIVTLFAVYQTISRERVFRPGWAIDYFRNGDEENESDPQPRDTDAHG